MQLTSTLFHRQQHKNFTFTTTLEYTPTSTRDLAGIVCLQSESFNYIFGVTYKDGDYYIVLQRSRDGKSVLLGG